MKEEALEVLKNRRSIRKFKAEQVSQPELDAVLEAGLYAATGMDRQGVITVAVQDKQTVEKLNSLNTEARGDGGMKNPYYGAPTILLVFATKEAIVPQEDAILCAANMMNAAYAVGLGSCWIHVLHGKKMMELPLGVELMKEWGIPKDAKCYVSIALGYPDCEHPKASPRKEGRIVKIL